MPNIIDSIQISSSTFDVRDKSATTVVNLTQEQYDNLPSSAKTANILYNITDAEAVDLSQYWTSAETQSAITEATSGKVSTSDFNTYSGSVDTALNSKASQTDLNALSDTVTVHTANTSIHVTAQDKTNWNNKSDFSGSYNDLTDKPTIPTSASQLTNDAGYITSSALDDYTTTATTSALNNVVTAHTANTSIHVSAEQIAAWNAKSDFSGSYNDLTDKPTIPIVPTNVSSFNNDAGYITSNDISGKTNQSDFTAHTANTTVHVTSAEKAAWDAKSDFSGNYNDLSNKPTIPTSASQLTNDSGYITSSALDGYATEAYVTAATNDMATKTWVGQQGYLTQHQDISGKQDVSGMTAYTTTATTNALSGTVTAHTANTTIHVTAQDKTNWNNKSDFSGDYNDLTNKPTIPTVPTNVSDFTNDAGYITVNDITGKTNQTDFVSHSGNTTMHVTASEKNTWNNKSDFSGSYNDLTDKPTIPTSVSQLTNDSGYITSGDAQTQIDSSISGKADTSAVTQDIAAAVSGKLDTSTFEVYSGNVETALSGKQDTLSAGTNITIVDNVISAEGGGKAIEAGRGISVTTGETADTVSFNLPISAGTGTNSIKCGESSKASGYDSFAIGGSGVKASSTCSFAGGSYSEAKGIFSMAFGRYNTTNNYGEVALGFFNKSNGSSSAAENSSGNTLFSVGNGTNSTTSTRHNAFEIRQNGDIYLSSGGTDIKLQDHLGGGGSTYTAGRGIDITNSAISISLPISAGTGSSSIIEGHTGNTASGQYSHAEGGNTSATTMYAHTEGYGTKASGLYAHAEGGNTSAITAYAHAEGNCTIATNRAEHASGQYNISSTASTTFGDSGNTLFSIGNGVSDSARHNAVEIRQNGDIYLSNGTNDVKLQDYIQIKAVKISQSDYDQLQTKDPNTLYIITTT